MEPYRLPQGKVAWNDLSGALNIGDGYVYRYVARAQPLYQLLVQVVVTHPVPTKSLRLDGKCGIVLVGLQQDVQKKNDEPWRYKTVPDNVAGNVMFGLVAKFASGPAPHLRVCLAGRASGFGQPHSLSPSEARPWCRPDSKFVVRQREPIEDLSGLRHVLSVNRKAGNEAFTSEFVSGSPVRFVCRGVGGPRILGMPPYPVSRQF